MIDIAGAQAHFGLAGRLCASTCGWLPGATAPRRLAALALPPGVRLAAGRRRGAARVQPVARLPRQPGCAGAGGAVGRRLPGLFGAARCRWRSARRRWRCWACSGWPRATAAAWCWARARARCGRQRDRARPRHGAGRGRPAPARRRPGRRLLPRRRAGADLPLARLAGLRAARHRGRRWPAAGFPARQAERPCPGAGAEGAGGRRRHAPLPGRAGAAGAGALLALRRRSAGCRWPPMLRSALLLVGGVALVPAVGERAAGRAPATPRRAAGAAGAAARPLRAPTRPRRPGRRRRQPGAVRGAHGDGGQLPRRRGTLARQVLPADLYARTQPAAPRPTRPGCRRSSSPRSPRCPASRGARPRQVPLRSRPQQPAVTLMHAALRRPGARAAAAGAPLPPRPGEPGVFVSERWRRSTAAAPGQHARSAAAAAATVAGRACAASGATTRASSARSRSTRRLPAPDRRLPHQRPGAVARARRRSGRGQKAPRARRPTRRCSTWPAPPQLRRAVAGDLRPQLRRHLLPAGGGDRGRPRRHRGQPVGAGAGAAQGIRPARAPGPDARARSSAWSPAKARPGWPPAR